MFTSMVKITIMLYVTNDHFSMPREPPTLEQHGVIDVGRGLLEIHCSQIIHLQLLTFSKWAIILSLLRINLLISLDDQQETAPMENS